HTYSTDWNSDATNHWHECSCGEKELQTAHTYGEFVVTKEATHTEDGSKKQTCSVCGYENVVVIEKLGHDLVHHDAKDPTCTEIGWNEYYSCSSCDYTTYQEIAAIGHTYGNLVPAVSATCEDDGNVAYYQCSACNKYFNENREEIDTIVVPATGHTYEDWSIDEIEHWHQCSCGHTDDRSEHEYENGACKYCGYRYISEGLDFILSDDETYYMVVINVCNDGFINIPSEYENLPVKSILSMRSSYLYGIYIPNSIIAICDFAFGGYGACINLTTVVFEDNSSLEYIGSSAFAQCSSLNTIEIPESVTEIGNGAFSECYNLESVTFAEGSKLEVLSPGVFNSTNITNIDIPQSVKKIGDYAFGGCQSLESIILPQNLEIIGEGAFNNSKLKKIEIPESVTEIGNGAFDECYNLESVTFAEGSKLEVLSPDVFNSCYKLSKINIPQSVTTISEMAFYNNQSLLQIVIPQNVTTIGDEAFNLCINLLEVYNLSELNILAGSFDHGYVGAYANKIHTSLDEESIYVDIEDYTFSVIDGDYTLLRYNGNDNNIVLPVIENVNYKIGNGAFANTNITTLYVSEGVTEIGISAFEECSNLIQVTLSSTVTTIKDNAFMNCRILEIYNYSELKLEYNSEDYGYIAINACAIHTTKDEESILITIDDYLFIYDADEDLYVLLGYNGKDTEVVLPELVNGKGYYVSNISFNQDIISVVVPNTVIGIDQNTFKSLKSVQKIEIHAKIQKLYNGMFSELKELKEVFIPNTVKTIESGAFYNCVKLENVIFEENSSLASIYSAAFTECSSLKEITLPDSVKNLNQYCFANCGLTKFTTPANLEVIGTRVFDRCMSLEEVVIGSSVITINASAFSNLTKLNKITFAENSKLQYIGMNAFSDTGIVNITIPSSVTTIDQYPFYGCKKLEILSFEDGIEITSLSNMLNDSNVKVKEIKIPKNVVELEYSLFSGLYNLEAVVFESGSKLEKISSSAFQNTKLNNIILPKELKYIGDYAFANCKNLVSVDFEEGSSLETIASSAFSYCDKLTSVSLPDSIITMNNNVFDKCISLKNINIPKSLTAISNSLFIDCEGLERIELNDKITCIGHNAFNRCSSLVEIVIPSSVTEIGDYVFNNCSKLSSITFEEGSKLESIGSNAFSGCTSLTEIIIPNTVTSIGSNAFSGCENLKIYLSTASQASGFAENWHCDLEVIYLDNKSE
ncbi:MAG: leucine-rich repeat domain-containing protein, partial [Anaeroplasma sp.]|nr:leucine-rich repeat domain-containing protein [Anaeroplasma sp.]